MPNWWSGSGWTRRDKAREQKYIFYNKKHTNMKDMKDMKELDLNALEKVAGGANIELEADHWLL